MKTLVLLLIIVLSPCGNAKWPEPYSADWLEKGCLGLVVYKKDRANWTPAQAQLSSDVFLWMKGFLGGLNASVMVDDKDEKRAAPKILYQPDTWLNGESGPEIAASLLRYIDENRKRISSEMSAARLLLSWYLVSHPNATQWNKDMAEAILIDASEKRPPNTIPVAKVRKSN